MKPGERYEMVYKESGQRKEIKIVSGAIVITYKIWDQSTRILER